MTPTTVIFLRSANDSHSSHSSFSQLIQSCQKWQYRYQRISQEPKKVTSSGSRPDDHWIKRLSLVQDFNALPTELVWMAWAYKSETFRLLYSHVPLILGESSKSKR